MAHSSENPLVRLNIYAFNALGYHSGVENSSSWDILWPQVCGEEYSFGDFDGCLPYAKQSGIWTCRPRTAGFELDATFTESIIVGRAQSTEDAVHIIRQLASEPQWEATEYNLLRHNCNHFTEVCSHALTAAHEEGGVEAPKYLNRAANLGAAIIPKWAFAPSRSSQEEDQGDTVDVADNCTALEENPIPLMSPMTALEENPILMDSPAILKLESPLISPIVSPTCSEGDLKDECVSENEGVNKDECNRRNEHKSKNGNDHHNSTCKDGTFRIEDGSQDNAAGKSNSRLVSVEDDSEWKRLALLSAKRGLKKKSQQKERRRAKAKLEILMGSPVTSKHWGEAETTPWWESAAERWGIEKKGLDSKPKEAQIDKNETQENEDEDEFHDCLFIEADPLSGSESDGDRRQRPQQGSSPLGLQNPWNPDKLGTGLADRLLGLAARKFRPQPP